MKTKHLVLAVPVAAAALVAVPLLAFADPGGAASGGPGAGPGSHPAPLSSGPFVECLREQGIPIPEWSADEERPMFRDLDIDRDAMRSAAQACRDTVPGDKIRAHWHEQVTPEQRQEFAQCVKDTIDPAAEHPIRAAMRECRTVVLGG